MPRIPGFNNLWKLSAFDFETMPIGLWGEWLRELRSDLCALEILEHTCYGVKIK